MSSIVHIPFNFQPVSTFKTASTYTVPAGKYAKVLVKFATTRLINTFVTTTVTPATITLNSNVILSEKEFYLAFGSGFVATGNVNITGDWTFEGSILSSTGSVGNLSFGTTINYFLPVSFNGSLVITSSVLSGKITNHSKRNEVELWLKAGDVLDCSSSNWEAFVIEYQSLS